MAAWPHPPLWCRQVPAASEASRAPACLQCADLVGGSLLLLQRCAGMVKAGMPFPGALRWRGLIRRAFGGLLDLSTDPCCLLLSGCPCAPACPIIMPQL